MGKWKSSYNAARAYKTEWEKDHTWLTNKDDSCYCKLCNCAINTMKKCNLVLHENTEKHKRASISVMNSTLKRDSIKTEEISTKDRMKRKLIQKKIKTADGSFVVVESPSDMFTKETGNDGPTAGVDKEYVQGLSQGIVDVFKVDLESMLDKNIALVRSIRNNPGFTRGDEGISRLTRLLVGHLAQQYLTDYSIESWKIGSTSSSKNIVASRLTVLEEAFEKSMAEMRKIKSQFQENQECQMFGVSPVEIFKDS